MFELEQEEKELIIQVLSDEVDKLIDALSDTNVQVIADMERIITKLSL